MLLPCGADDQYVPEHQLADQLDALTNAASVTARIFTAADQAQNHCQIGNVGLALRCITNWLETLPARAGGRAGRAMLRQTAAVARRILTELARQRRSLIFWVVFPVLMLVLFGEIYRGGATSGSGGIVSRVSFDATPAAGPRPARPRHLPFRSWCKGDWRDVSRRRSEIPRRRRCSVVRARKRLRQRHLGASMESPPRATETNPPRCFSERTPTVTAR